MIRWWTLGGSFHRHATSSPLGAAGAPTTGGFHWYCRNSSTLSGACGTTGTPTFAVLRVLLQLLSTLLLMIAFPRSSVWAALVSLPPSIRSSHLLLPWLAFSGFPSWRNDAGSFTCGLARNVLLMRLLSCLSKVGINTLSQLTFNHDGSVIFCFRHLLSLHSLPLPCVLARCALRAFLVGSCATGSKFGALRDQQRSIRALPSHNCPHKFQF